MIIIINLSLLIQKVEIHEGKKVCYIVNYALSYKNSYVRNL